MKSLEPNWKRLRHDAKLRARLAKRQEIISAVRAFFVADGFQEVETPIVVPVPGTEPHLDPFAVTVVTQDGRRLPAALITSPEYSLKKLLAAGYGKIFEITRTFRNGEPWGAVTAGERTVTHNPEFSMIEWYRTGTDYRTVMHDTERLVAAVAAKTCGGMTVKFNGAELDLSAPWPVLTVAEAMRKYADIDLDRGLDDPDWFRQAVAAKGCSVSPTDTFDDVFFRIFLRDVEPCLSEPVPGQTCRPLILCEYPASMAALARLKPTDRRYAERFEVYCAGLELGNAYSELNDAAEQRRRIEEENALRAQLGKPVYGTDEQFLEAVAQMPESAGIAFGLDRLVMLLTDAPSIEDVLFFPAKDLFK